MLSYGENVRELEINVGNAEHKFLIHQRYWDENWNIDTESQADNMNGLSSWILYIFDSFIEHYRSRRQRQKH